MPRVMFNCPEKGTSVPVGVDSNLGAEWDQLDIAGKVLDNCPACGKPHDIMKREAYLEGYAPRKRLSLG